MRVIVNNINEDNIKEKDLLKYYIFQFVSKYKIYFISLTIIAIVSSILEISVDYKIKEIIDTIASSDSVDLGYLIILFALFKLMYHGSYFVVRLLDIRYKPNILGETLTDIYLKTTAHSLHWFDSHLSGEISSKISDFQNSISALITYLFRTLYTISTIVITLFFLKKLNSMTFIVLLIFIIIYTPIIYYLLKKQLALQGNLTATKQEAIGIINDSIANIFGIKVVGNLLSEFKLKLKPSIEKLKSLDRKAKKFDAYYIDNADTIMVTVMSTAQVYLLAYLYKSGEITVGSFAFITIMTLKIHTQLETLLENILFNINPSIAQIKASYAFVSSKIDVKDAQDAKHVKNIKGVIEYRNVTFSYGDNVNPVLSNFSLKIKEGERIGIVGPTGAGKTTIIKCLLRYFDVSNGEILVDGHDIKMISQDSLRESISIIPQDITMFHRSIRDNLKIAKEDATDEELIATCKKARIHDSIISMKGGYDAVVGERGVKLSGGERQRIAIARAILKNAPILILDEATSSLDTKTEELIQESIEDILNKDSKTTVIAIAHRLSTLKRTDRIIVLSHGHIVQEGSHNELMSQEGIYKELWDAQIGGFLGDKDE